MGLQTQVPLQLTPPTSSDGHWPIPDPLQGSWGAQGECRGTPRLQQHRPLTCGIDPPHLSEA